MRYTILGSTQALRDDGTPVALAGGRLRALLTALALRPGRVVPADALIDEVWDGEPPSGATGALQALVGRLRRALGHHAVASVEGGYRLVAAREDVDLFRFERLAEEGARALADGDPVRAVGLLGDALALWRGPALADLPDRGTAAVRSEAMRLDAQRGRLTAELALGRAGHVLPELAELAAAHPLDEPLRALHIRALRSAGRTADALAAYEAVRRDLADRLGADPSPELRALHAELLNPRPWPASAPAGGPSPDARALVEDPRLPVEVPATGPAGPSAAGRRASGARPAAAPAPMPYDGGGDRWGGGGARPAAPGNRRARLTSFVGREGELAVVRDDLARSRLVTVTGPGGTGKTRLTQEAGDLMAGRWADGVWYVELAPVSDPRTVPEAVINSLGLRETLLHAGSAAGAAIAAETKPRDAVRQLADYCATREILLVLDNCEHVIDAAAALAEQLLADCPALSVLATSREPLGVPGELVRPLDPLPDPTALRLLADRGAAARPGFAVQDDPVACAELCRRLDGLPLAIELAAARLRSLSPRQLADRLDDRFRLLTGGSRTLLPRQQTLRAVVDWSWDLLEPAERVLLRRLAVFRGGWTLEAAEAICADPTPEPAPPAPPGGFPGPTGSGTPGGYPAASGAGTPAGFPGASGAGGADGFRHRTGAGTSDSSVGPTGAGAAGGYPAASGAGASAGFPGASGAGGAGGFPGPTGAGMPAGFPGASGAGASGGFPGPAGEAGSGERISEPDVAALLSSLVDKSLVLVELTADGNRFRMLETIAEYAAGRLAESGERAAVERRHITYFREYVRLADPQLRGAGQLVWFERLEREHDNLRAALARAVAAGDEQEALMLVLGCGWFWEVRNYSSERRHWPAVVAGLGPDPFAQPPSLEPLERGPLDDPPPLEGERLLEARRYARVLDLSSMEGADSDWWTDPRVVRVGEALIASYPPHLPQSARQPGIMRPYGAFFSGDFHRLHELMDETVACCRRHGRDWELAFTLQLRAKINNDVTERVEHAVRDIGESRRIFERLGDVWGTSETLSAEAEAASNSGDWARAARCCRRGIELARKVGSHAHVPVLMVRLGDALVNAGEPEEGERLLREGIEDAERFGVASDGAAFYGRVLLAGILARRNNVPEALELIQDTIDRAAGGSQSVPAFVFGMLHAMKGYLIGKAGDPVRGLTMLGEGIEELSRHPLADVITPRLGIVLAPAAAELLVLLTDAEPAAGAQRRALTAARLLNAHDRLRPTAIPPGEARETERVRERLRGLLGADGYAAAYAEGGELTLEDAIALMCGTLDAA